jgi:N6-L-threonylcarbamoyladenine synthase
VIILGIETSCDETAAAVVRDGRFVLSNIIRSQVDLHQRYGGVVPELASRRHVTSIVPVLDLALEQAGSGPSAIDAIAVTEGPGLAGSLLVGINVAKTLAFVWEKPLIPVNHLEGHIYANWLTLPGQDEVPEPTFPLVCLIVSGGHTELVLMRGHGDYVLLGRTLDDAAGRGLRQGRSPFGIGISGWARHSEGRRAGTAGSIFPAASLAGRELRFQLQRPEDSVVAPPGAIPATAGAACRRGATLSGIRSTGVRAERADR